MADWSNFGVGVANSAASMGMSLLGNSISGLINNLFYRRNLDLQVQAQKDLIDYQNQYNDPSAQMQRLLGAGLNPNLVYGSSAPAGQSGNASAPSGVANPGANFGTTDVVSSMLKLQQMNQSEAQTENINAQAAYYEALAKKANAETNRYDETIDQQLKESDQRIKESISRIGLNDSSIQVNQADVLLKDANRRLTEGKITNLQYEREVMTAQTALYQSDAALKDMTRNKMRTEWELLKLEYEYKKIMLDPDLAAKGVAAQKAEFEKAAAAAAARMGIEGSKAVQWTNQAFSWLGSLVGAAASVGIGVGGFGAGMKALGAGVQASRVYGLQ